MLEETAAEQRIDTKARVLAEGRERPQCDASTEVKSNLMDIGIQCESKRDKTGDR